MFPSSKRGGTLLADKQRGNLPATMKLLQKSPPVPGTGDAVGVLSDSENIMCNQLKNRF